MQIEEKPELVFDEINGNPTVMLNTGKPKLLAVVDFEALKRMSSFLNSVPFEKIKDNAIKVIAEVPTFESYMDFLETELNFHRTFNLINKTNYKDVMETIGKREAVQEALLDVNA